MVSSLRALFLLVLGSSCSVAWDIKHADAFCQDFGKVIFENWEEHAKSDNDKAALWPPSGLTSQRELEIAYMTPEKKTQLCTDT